MPQKNSRTREDKIKRRKERRAERRAAKQNLSANDGQFEQTQPMKSKKTLEPIHALTEAQGHYILSIKSNILTFGTGPAGTGKTYVAAALAAEQLDAGNIERIIITRPGVEAGESFGFLPGEIEEKYEPYIEPFRDALEDRLGKSYVEYLIKHKRIEPKPLAFMRGKSFKDSWIILDEAQNATPTQMKLFLSRIGENCKVIVDGDVTQKDISGQSGLSDAVSRLRNLNKIGVVDFGTDDIVRSGIVKDIIMAYQE